MVIKELKLDRATRYGRDPMEMARRLFTHYRRGLYIDTGIEGREAYLDKTRAFCLDFGLTLETTTADTTLLSAWLEKGRSATAPRGERASSSDITKVADGEDSP